MEYQMTMQREVEIAGNGVDLLNDHTTKRDSIVSVEWVRSCLQSRSLGYGTASPSIPGSCPESFEGADKMLPRFTEKKKHPLY
jgi:hypothetical protein